MNQKDFADIVWKQWATAPDGKNQPEELRPMKEIQLYGVDSIEKGSGDKDFPWMFVTWVFAYPNNDDPWMSHPMSPNERVMQSAMGIWTALDNEELFKLKEKMVDLDKAYLKEYKDDGGKVIRIVQEMGYRTVFPFLSTFNKSVYDVIFREHQRLLNDVGKSYLAKALLRFELWFKEEGIADHNKIKPFWSSDFDADAIGAAKEPERKPTPPLPPTPLSDKDKWEDVLLELDIARLSGDMNLIVKHPNLAKDGFVLSIDGWQRKHRTMLTAIAFQASRKLDRQKLGDAVSEADAKYDKGVNKQDINRFNETLKAVIGITYDNPIQHMEKERGGRRMMTHIGEHPVLPYIRLTKRYVKRYLKINIDRDVEAMGQEDLDITDDTFKDYATQWLRCKPAWYKQT
jgi:hypothetical protein